MSENAVKQRLNKAIKRAVASLEEVDYDVIIIPDNVFTIHAERIKEIRKIMIVLDKVSSIDIRIVREKSVPEVCTKEIWCAEKRKKKFKKIIIN